MEAVFAVVGVIGIVIGLLILASIWRGFVVYKLWGWFVVPLGAVPITVAWAIGLSVLIGMFTADIKGDPDDEKRTSGEKVLHKFGLAFLAPLIVLGVGWVAKQYMPGS